MNSIKFVLNQSFTDIQIKLNSSTNSLSLDIWNTYLLQLVKYLMITLSAPIETISTLDVIFYNTNNNKNKQLAIMGVEIDIIVDIVASPMGPPVIL